MNTLVIASLRNNAGKTSLIAGLSKALQKKVGYMKPFGDRLLYSKKRLWDHDAAVMAHLHHSKESPDSMSIGFDHSKLRYMYDEAKIKDRLHELAARMGKEKDVLFVEGGKAIPYGESVHLDSLSLARYLDSRLIFVTSGDEDTILDDIMFVKKNVDLEGIDLAGVIVNKVQDLDDFKETYLPVLTDLGISVLGVIPYQDELSYFSLAYLSDRLFAKVLTAEENLDRRVKNILIGAMSGSVAISKAVTKKEDKVIITGGDRSDMILAGLQVNAVGIILTNNVLPPSNIISKAEEKGTPMLLVTPDTYQVAQQIERMEPLLTKDDPDKVEILKNIVQENVDIKALNL